MKILMIVIMFFVIGALFIISENNLYMGKAEDSGKFSKLYSAWLDNIFSNIKSVTGYVINLDWLPKNETG